MPATRGNGTDGPEQAVPEAHRSASPYQSRAVGLAVAGGAADMLDWRAPGSWPSQLARCRRFKKVLCVAELTGGFHYGLDASFGIVFGHVVEIHCTAPPRPHARAETARHCLDPQIQDHEDSKPGSGQEVQPVKQGEKAS